MNDNELSEEKSAEILGQIQNLQLTREEAVEVLGEEAVVQAHRDLVAEHSGKFAPRIVTASGVEIKTSNPNDFISQQQAIYDSSFNHTLLSNPNGYPEVEDFKRQGETIPYDPSWLVSDNPDVVRMAQKGADDATAALENIAEVHRMNDGMAR